MSNVWIQDTTIIFVLKHHGTLCKILLNSDIAPSAHTCYHQYMCLKRNLFRRCLLSLHNFSINHFAQLLRKFSPWTWAVPNREKVAKTEYCHNFSLHDFYIFSCGQIRVSATFKFSDCVLHTLFQWFSYLRSTLSITGSFNVKASRRKNIHQKMPIFKLSSFKAVYDSTSYKI